MRKVLIVDDSEINRKVLRNILRVEYDVLEADNGEEALAILRRERDGVSAVLLDLGMPVMDGFEVLSVMRADEGLAGLPVIVATGDVDAEVRALSMGASDFVAKPYNAEVIRHRLWNTINLRETAAFINTIQNDKLTGLYNREAFFARADELIAAKPAGHYVMACFDINNFKVVNDQYGNQKGDEVLCLVAEVFRQGFEPVGGICARIMADNFAVLYPVSFMDTPELADIRRRATELDGSIEPITYSIGRYIVDDLTLSASAMYDRASIAENSIKARFDTSIAQYNEGMRQSILREHEIIGGMNAAIALKQFEVWFQPQYNHSSGALIGAEALVRWRHPDKGIISPGEFIPVFERNGFIYEMDKYI